MEPGQRGAVVNVIGWRLYALLWPIALFEFIAGGRAVRRPAGLAGALAAVIVAVASACVSPSPARGDGTTRKTTAEKRGANPVRHELEPLRTRYPALGSPLSASWVSGDMGDPDVPGPSLYWLDAVVTLTPEIARGLVQKYRPTITSVRPDVWPTLSDALPPGPLLAGEDLDAAFTSQKVKAKAYLARDEPVIVLVGTGE